MKFLGNYKNVELQPEFVGDVWHCYTCQGDFEITKDDIFEVIKTDCWFFQIECPNCHSTLAKNTMGDNKVKLKDGRIAYGGGKIRT